MSHRPTPRRPEATAAAPETFLPAPPGEAARDVSDAPPPPEILKAEPVSQESQWGMVWREFRKRPMAVAAAGTILTVVTLCVFAPLLANDRPIAYVGANRYFYADAARTVRVQLSNMADDGALVPMELGQAVRLLVSLDKPPSELVSTLRAAAEAARSKTPGDLSELQEAVQEWAESDVASVADRRAVEDAVTAAANAANHFSRSGACSFPN